MLLRVILQKITYFSYFVIYFVYFRSSYDEYTPADQVEYIQSSLLQVLSSCYGENTEVHKCYQTDE